MGSPFAVQKPLSWTGPRTTIWVPVTGLLTDSSGEEWHRVEYRQQILWSPTAEGRVRISLAGLMRRQGAQASGYRSCEPVVMFPPPHHTLCPKRSRRPLPGPLRTEIRPA